MNSKNKVNFVSAFKFNCSVFNWNDNMKCAKNRIGHFLVIRGAEGIVPYYNDSIGRIFIKLIPA